jgi:hypothetical protein
VSPVRTRTIDAQPPKKDSQEYLQELRTILKQVTKMEAEPPQHATESVSEKSEASPRAGVKASPESKQEQSQPHQQGEHTSGSVSSPSESHTVSDEARAKEVLKDTFSRIESRGQKREVTPKELEHMMRVTGGDTLP